MIDNIIEATDKQFKGSKKGPVLILGGGYRDESTFERQYIRCEYLDKWEYDVMACNTGYKIRDVNILLWLDIIKEKFIEEVKNLNCLKFVFNQSNFHRYPFQTYSVKMGLPEQLSLSLDKGLFFPNLAGLFALNMALILGYSPIVLSGFNPFIPDQKMRSMWIYKIVEKFDDIIPIYTTDTGLFASYFKFKRIPEILSM